ncbi:bifunctional folylpolyglutamate synthase/dihydrofolate synthase [Mangrovimonas aestuarii]|uniref:bifunctional folylpolyglutamate synthase/dihydrofolate synthase n=1 Tax=Mangrovimonas aestuarii TaxID=3018443 RepID=UPI002379DA76|nr:folylpolyglutamate synthase/dihydrofolate synthase family protein [Mangrovimonas aestuarii]
MTYQETLHWMFEQLPMYQRQGKTAFKKDLSNTIKLASHLGNPETKFKSIHVAGTNGKGSTSHMLASILQEAGYKVGLYTSPHLKDFRERIKINGEPVSESFVVDFIQDNKAFFEANKLSFFEMTVGMAFDYFAKEKVDIAVIEVGMGGRLDSTNIIIPELSIITNIGLDHTQFLGDTLEEIAAEKGGIIKEGVPVVIGETNLKTKPVFQQIAKERKADIKFADEINEVVLKSDLKGVYQKHNIKAVLQSIQVLKSLGFQLEDKAVSNGLLNVVKNTGLMGRWQVLQKKPKVICDTAHNKEGLTYVMSQLNEESYDRLHIVIGVVNDKDLMSIIPLFPKDATYYFAKPDIPRGLDAFHLKEFFVDNGFLGEVYASVGEAYRAALEGAAENDLVFVGGSTFVVAEII